MLDEKLNREIPAWLGFASEKRFAILLLGLWTAVQSFGPNFGPFSLHFLSPPVSSEESEELRAGLFSSTVKLFCAHIHRRRSDRECQCGFVHAAAQQRDFLRVTQWICVRCFFNFPSPWRLFSSVDSCWRVQPRTCVQFALRVTPQWNVVTNSAVWRLSHVSNVEIWRQSQIWFSQFLTILIALRLYIIQTLDHVTYLLMFLSSSASQGNLCFDV